MEDKIEAIDILSGAASYADYSFIDKVFTGCDRQLFEDAMKLWADATNLYSFCALAPKKIGEKTLEKLGIAMYRDIIFPFASFCNSATLRVLKDISSDAWQTVKEYDIDIYEKGSHWATLWLNTTDRGKSEILIYIENREKKTAETLPF